MPTISRSPELEAVLIQAQEIAEEAGQRLTTAHVILALFTIPNRAETLLKEREVDEDRLLEVLGSRSDLHDEPLEVIAALDDRIELAAESTGATTAGCLHLLFALARLQASSANRMMRSAGVDLAKLRNQIIAYLTNRMPRRLGGSQPGQIRRELERTQQAPQAPQPVAATATAEAPVASAPAPEPVAARSFGGAGASSPAAVSAQSRLATTTETVDLAPLRLDPREFPLLESMGRNLSLLAAEGQVDPVIGRDREVDEILDILSKRRANNPCLIGEPGVGKTAVVEGLALNLWADQARRGRLGERLVVELNVGELIKDTHLRGSLAKRLSDVKDEIRRASGRVVVFIDELHTLVGAGATAEGGQDVAGDLKAALARGEFPCIGATTPNEYRKSIETDQALARRFQTVFVEEPAQGQALAILRGISETYGQHHGVEFDDDALEAAVRLSARYLRERRLPAKALDVIDLAGARAQREGSTRVGRDDVARVVAGLAHLPEEKLLLSDAERLMQLEELLARQIVGHQEIVTTVSRALRRSSAGFGSRRPLGSFLFLGPTGVGKTELAKVLADALFQGRDAVVRLDMSEFAEPHSLARLVGAPPGYLGHDEGGQLTEAIRRRPYALVLLDEVEKAHREVLQVLLQILDEGHLTDGRGRSVDFTSTVVVLTSNLGSDHFRAGRRVGFDTGGDQRADVTQAVLDAARRALSPELWNRIEHPLVFLPLSRGEVRQIAQRQLRDSAQHLEEERGITYRVDDAVLDHLVASGGYDPELGARPMRRTIARLIEGELSQRILAGEFASPDAVRVLIVDGELRFQKET